MTISESPLSIVEQQLEHGHIVKSVQTSFQKTFNGTVFPLVLGPARHEEQPSFEALSKWSTTNKLQIRTAMKQHGAVLFRGFNCLNTAKAFNDFVESLEIQPLPYVGGAATRTKVYGHAFTSNESPPSQLIPFHHEMAQVPKYPASIFFWAELPAQSGGSTPILRSDMLVHKLSTALPEFVKELEEKGIVYTRVMPAEDDTSSPIGRSWKSTFLTGDRQVAQHKAQELNVTLTWLDNGDVESRSGLLPAIKSYEGKKVFFNSMVAAYLGWSDSRNNRQNAVKYGDGTSLNPHNIELTKDIMDDICVDFPWQLYDLICIDNSLVMHSRTSFEPPRRLLAYVGENI